MKNCRSGSGAKPRKQYIYYNLLTFLQPLAEIRPPTGTTDSDEVDVDTEESLDSFFVAPDPKSMKIKKSASDDRQDKLYDALIEKLKKDTPAIQHPDQHFLISLFPHFNSIKEEYKLDAKADIINLLRKYNNMGQTLTYASNYGYQSGYQSYHTLHNISSNANSSSQPINSYLTPSSSANTASGSSQLDAEYTTFNNNENTQDSDIITDMYSP